MTRQRLTERAAALDAVDARESECRASAASLESKMQAIKGTIASQSGGAPQRELSDEDSLAIKMTHLRGQTRIESPIVLYVDDESANRHAFKLEFEDVFTVLVAETGRDALSIMATQPVDILVTDQRMPGMSGIELCRQARKQFPRIMRVLVSAYTDFAAAVDAINEAQVRCFINKPWQHDRLARIMKEAIVARQEATIVE